MNELDTAPDLIAYLSEKERAISQNVFQTIAGEEDLLAFYMMGMDSSFRSRLEVPASLKKDFPSMTIGEDFWQEYSISKERKGLKRGNRISYFGDEVN